MMIELKGRGFALLATVWRLGSPAISDRILKGGTTTQALSAFVTLTWTPPKLTRCLPCHVTKCSC